MISRIKGTQDLINLKLYNFLKDTISHHLTKFHFSEIQTPIIEPLELFKRSLGTETDVVSKEMYLVTTEHSTEEHICLRPEATASTVRAFYNNGIQTKPWKVFATGPMFRHERPQKGRFRQFTQTTIEMLGVSAVEQDVQLIMALDRLFNHVLQLREYGLHVNYLGCVEDRARFKVALGKFLDEHVSELCDNCLARKDRNIMRVFDCKTPSCQELYKSAPEILSFLCEACSQEWGRLTSSLSQLAVSYSYAPRLVRGLDYYNKTVFEFVSLQLGAQNTFCGGGRYDQLAKILGAPEDLPAIGAAIGIERLLALIEPLQDLLPIPTEPKLYVIAPMDEAQKTLALLIADELTASGLQVETLLEGNSLKSMLRTADKLGATAALIIGSDEQAAREVTVKFLTTGTSEKVPQSELKRRLLS